MILKTSKDLAALAADAITGAVWFARASVLFVFEFFASQWRQYNTFGQLLFLVAVVMIVNDAGISYEYGIRQSSWHGWAFAGIAVAFALFPDVAVTEFRKKNVAGGLAMAVVAALPGVLGAQPHLGHGGSIRMGMVSENGNNVKKTADADNSAKSEAENLATLRLMLATVTKERAELRAENPWAAKTTPEALEAEIANFEGDKVFKRSKSCADVTLPESRAFCDQVKDARARLANIKKISAKADRIDQLSKQIETAQARVDAKTAAAHASITPANDIANQAVIGAVLVNWFNGLRGEDALKPTAAQQHASNIFISAFNSVGMLMVAASLLVAAGFNRVPGALGWHGGNGGGLPLPAYAAAPVGSPVAANGNHPDMVAALAAAASRRHQVTERLVAMRQSRVDGGLRSRTG